MNTSVNSNVEITALRFQNKPQAGRLDSWPQRMVWQEREYNFVESGMQFLVQKGQELIRLFDVSDGQTDFRLRVDSQNHWTLVSVRS